MDWHSRPQRSRLNRDSSGESTADNSGSDSLAPYYSNPDSLLSQEELDEDDEKMFNLAGVYSESEYASYEETPSSAFDLLDMDELDADDEKMFNLAEVSQYNDVSATPVSQDRVAYNYLDAGEGEIVNTENLEETSQAEAEVAQEVIAGALMGDFNDDSTFWSDVGQIVTGLIPIAGQLGDARDLIHILDEIINKEGFKKIASWAALVLILIGFVPGVEDVIKSIGRRGLRYLDNNRII